jgi:drug/metabolite transporter (DMT)-like permease
MRGCRQAASRVFSARGPELSNVSTVTQTSSSDSTYRLVGIGLAVAGVFGFALRPIFIRLAYTYAVDPVTLLALRMIFSLPFFVLIATWSGRGSTRARLTRREHGAIILLGFLGYYAASFLDFLGLQYVSAGLGRLLLFLYPTIVVLLSAAFLGKRIVQREVLALVLCYAGVALVLSNAFEHPSANLPLGAAFVFGGAVIYAVYLVASSHVIQRVGSVRFTAYAMMAASVFCIIQFLLLRPLSALALPMPVYLLMLGVAVVSTVIPSFMVSEALRRIGANHVSLIGGLGPLVAIVLGYVGLDEAMTVLQFCGAALILAGVMIVSVRPARAD